MIVNNNTIIPDTKLWFSGELYLTETNVLFLQNTLYIHKNSQFTLSRRLLLEVFFH